MGITLDSVVRPSSTQVSSDLGGEAVILDLNQSVYHGLDAVGARIWELLQKGTSVREIRDTMLQEYDVTPEQCEQDLLNLLQQMAENGLIET